MVFFLVVQNLLVEDFYIKLVFFSKKLKIIQFNPENFKIWGSNFSNCFHSMPSNLHPHFLPETRRNGHQSFLKLIKNLFVTKSASPTCILCYTAAMLLISHISHLSSSRNMKQSDICWLPQSAIQAILAFLWYYSYILLVGKTKHKFPFNHKRKRHHFHKYVSSESFFASKAPHQPTFSVMEHNKA